MSMKFKTKASKANKRLAARQAGFDNMKTGKDGAFHRPGSGSCLTEPLRKNPKAKSSWNRKPDEAVSDLLIMQA